MGRRQAISALAGLAVPCKLAWTQAAAAASAPSLEFDCSDSALIASFRWAKAQALAYVFEDDPVGMWYEAALPGREAFCMRDVSHQAMGAHVLGLAPHTRNMLHRFAENIAESRDWCSYWEMDRYNRPAPVDYKNDAEFWYCLPANYDVLDACYRMYLWTGDASYISDPIFVNFYNRTVTDYEARWDLGVDRVMKRQRAMNVHGDLDLRQPFLQYRGNPGYDEGTHGYVLGVDLLATQYAAYRSYAAIQDTARNESLTRTFIAKAAAVKELINGLWWNAQSGQFYGYLNQQHQLAGHADASLLYRDVVNEGPKLSATLRNLEQQIEKHPSSGVEGESHLPEILFRYGNAGLARSQILDLTQSGRERREYPEVSYSVIGAIVTGLVGVTVEAEPLGASEDGGFVDRRVRTLACLGPVGWAEAKNIPMHRNLVTVRQDGPTRTTVTNQSGPSFLWRACFRGAGQQILVAQKQKPARTGRDPLGQPVSWVDIPIAPGTSIQAELPSGT